MDEELKPGEDEIARKTCGWALFVAEEDTPCETCPFTKCLYDVFDDAVEEFWQIFNKAYLSHRYNALGCDSDTLNKE